MEMKINLTAPFIHAKKTGKISVTSIALGKIEKG